MTVYGEWIKYKAVQTPKKYEEDKSTNQTLLKTAEIYTASVSRKTRPRTEDISWEVMHEHICIVTLKKKELFCHTTD